MSKFSDKCQEYLLQRNCTVYEFSKISGLERTTLHRMVTGKRLPSEDFLEHFCSFARLSMKQTRELKELYQEAKIGVEKYQNRRFIREILANLADSESVPMNDVTSQELIMPMPGIEGELPDCTNTSFQTYNLIGFLLQRALAGGGEQSIYTNLPVTFGGYSKLLYGLFYTYKSHIKMYHLLTFLSQPAKQGNYNYNLEMLNGILHLALTPYTHYNPYYAYSGYMEQELDSIAYPFYLVADGYVVVVSGNLETAIISKSAKVVQRYVATIEQTLKSMKPLIQTAEGVDESLGFYYNLMKQRGFPAYTLVSSPCNTWFYESMDELRQMIRKLPKYQEYAQKVSVTIGPNFEKTREEYFTEKGLEYFVQTGKMPGQIGAYYPAMTVEERIAGLKCMLRFSQSDDVAVNMVRNSMKSPLHIYLDVYENQGLLFARIDPNLVRLKFCYITESSLCEAFHDFFASMKDTGLLVDKQETREKIRAYLQELEGKIR